VSDFDETLARRLAEHPRWWSSRWGSDTIGSALRDAGLLCYMTEPQDDVVIPDYREPAIGGRLFIDLLRRERRHEYDMPAEKALGIAAHRDDEAFICVNPDDIGRRVTEAWLEAFPVTKEAPDGR